MRVRDRVASRRTPSVQPPPGESCPRARCVKRFGKFDSFALALKEVCAAVCQGFGCACMDMQCPFFPPCVAHFKFT